MDAALDLTNKLRKRLAAIGIAVASAEATVGFGRITMRVVYGDGEVYFFEARFRGSVSAATAALLDNAEVRLVENTYLTPEQIRAISDEIEAAFRSAAA